MNSDQPDHSPANRKASAADDRLDSWKEIAAYLKREIRTLHRWEDEEGLPIHRHLHKERGSVYAYKSELDSWWNNRRAVLERPTVAADATHRSGRWKLISVSVGLAILLVAVAYFGVRRMWPGHRPTKIMLGVLPFENLSG